MLESIGEIFASSGLGAIVGAVGSWLGKREERKARQDEYAHESKMRDLDMQETQMTQAHEMAIADKEIQRAETEGQIDLDKIEASGWKESITQGFKQTGVKWVDGIRGLMRPLITVYLLAIASVVTYQLSRLVGGLEALPMDEVLDMYRHVISQLIFLTATAVTWWFGSRPQSHIGR